MIHFEKRILENGLKVICHHDQSTPMVAVNVLYDVGSKDEDENRTGFAHLFEHLMFSGSVNVPDFDAPIQNAGGENNAFTNADMTNYYDIVPAQNVETALWLESDRMMQLAFNARSLEVQKKVVVEEFKETCLNIPYGDLWHHLNALAYKVHPYRWPTIGLHPEHIENAKLLDVEAFFYKHYRPCNAILVIAGNIEPDRAFDLADKWFGNIEKGNPYVRNLPEEPIQMAHRQQILHADVPLPSITMAFPMPSRSHEDYYAYDLLSDVLSNGPSSRLYRNLIKDQSIFTEIDAFITGSSDDGLFIITGKPMTGVNMDNAKKMLWEEISELKSKIISKDELVKLKNKAESTLTFSEINILHKAMSLAYFELIGKAEDINSEADAYRKITVEDLHRIANRTLSMEHCNELVYLPSE